MIAILLVGCAAEQDATVVPSQPMVMTDCSGPTFSDPESGEATWLAEGATPDRPVAAYFWVSTDGGTVQGVEGVLADGIWVVATKLWWTTDGLVLPDTFGAAGCVVYQW